MRKRIFEDQHWRADNRRAPERMVLDALQVLERIEPKFKSRTQMARRIGIAPSSLLQYAWGRSRPSERTCRSIFELAREVERG
jgi:hypothetical protein